MRPLNQIEGFSRGLFYKTLLRVLKAKNARLRDAHGSWGSRRRESAPWGERAGETLGDGGEDAENAAGVEARACVLV